MPRIPSFPVRSAFVFRVTRVTAKLVLFPFFRIRAEGISHFPQQGGFILLPKHQRWEDIPLLALASPRPLYYVAKQELFRSPLARWFIASLGGIPLNRKRPLESRDSLRHVTGLLRKGEGVVVFPEGTYFPDAVGPGQRGLIRMLRRRADVPFLPVGIRYGKEGRPRPVRIAFGEPVRRIPGMDEAEWVDGLMREISALSDLPLSSRDLGRAGRAQNKEET